MKLPVLSKLNFILNIAFLFAVSINADPDTVDTLNQNFSNRYWNGFNISATALSTVSTGLFAISLFSYSEAKRREKQDPESYIPLDIVFFGFVYIATGVAGGICSITSVPLWMTGYYRNHPLKVNPDISVSFSKNRKPVLYVGINIF